METIKIAVKTKDTLSIELLTPLQGDLKILQNENYQKLKNEILADGFSFSIFVWENPADAKIYIIDGHQRYATLKKMKEEGYSIPQVPVVFIEADDLNHAKKKILAAASQYGTFDQNGAEEFLRGIQDISLDFLKQQIEMPFLNFDAMTFEDPEKILVSSHLREKFDPNEELEDQEITELTEEEQNFYSKKIATPIYEPTGEKPSISDLIDSSKYKELCAQIDKSNLNTKEKEFLLMAATRHIVFNYDKIANYYAHSEKQTQELFENSALVIIDFNKAVENGFIKLSKQISESYVDNQKLNQENEKML